MWQRIRDEVRNRIRARDWLPGELIPNEEDLAIEYGCARATISRALRQLAEDGLLERKRKAGTRVALTPIRHARLSIPMIRNEIEDSGATYGYALIRRDIARTPTHLRLRLDLEVGLHVEALHLANGQPYVFEQRWINPDALPAVRDLAFDDISPNEWLVRNASYSTGEIAFLAEAATEKDAEVLNLNQGDPVFIVERVTRSDSATITWVRMAYRPGHRMVSPI